MYEEERLERLSEPISMCLVALGTELTGLCYVQQDPGSPGRAFSEGVRQSHPFMLLHLVLPREVVPNDLSLFRLL